MHCVEHCLCCHALRVILQTSTLQSSTPRVRSSTSFRPSTSAAFALGYSSLKQTVGNAVSHKAPAVPDTVPCIAFCVLHEC